MPRSLPSWSRDQYPRARRPARPSAPASLTAGQAHEATAGLELINRLDSRGAFAVLGGDCVNPPIGQALASDTNEGDWSALLLRHSAGIVVKVGLFIVTA